MVEESPLDSTETLSGDAGDLAGISELKPSLLGSAMYSLLPVRRRIVMENCDCQDLPKRLRCGCTKRVAIVLLMRSFWN